MQQSLARVELINTAEANKTNMQTTTFFGTKTLTFVLHIDKIIFVFRLINKLLVQVGVSSYCLI